MATDAGGPRDRFARGWAGAPPPAGREASADAVTQQLLDQSAEKLIRRASRCKHQGSSAVRRSIRPQQTRKGLAGLERSCNPCQRTTSRKHQVSEGGRHAGCRQDDRQVCPWRLPASRPLPSRGPSQGAQLSNGTLRSLRVTAPILCTLDSVNAETAQRSYGFATLVDRSVPLYVARPGCLRRTCCNAPTAPTVLSSSVSRSTPVSRPGTSPALSKPTSEPVACSLSRLPDDGLLVLETASETPPLCSYRPVS